MDRLGGAFDSFDGHDSFDDFVDDSDSHSNPPPSPVGQDERRMQVRAYNHWASLLGDNRLPAIEDLEPEFLGDFGPHSVLLDFSTGSATPTIQFIGDKLSRECGLYEDIEDLSEVPKDSLLSQIADNYLKIVSEQAPTGFEAEFVNAKGATVLYRGILLPYSSDCETLDFVYAVINWKEVADAETADALLQQIDDALEEEAAAPIAEAPAAPNPAPLRKRNPLQLSDPEEAPSPAPAAFEAPVEEPAPFEEQAPFETEAFEEAEEASAPAPLAAPAAKARGVDALGNPIGGAPAGDAEAGEGDDGYNSPMTAADYGLPEWDDEDYEEDDVDEVINPLADIDLNSRLLSLVNPQARVKKSLDLHGEESEDETAEEAESVDSVDETYFAAEEAGEDFAAEPAPEAVAEEEAYAEDYAEPVLEEPEAFEPVAEEVEEEFAAEPVEAEFEAPEVVEEEVVEFEVEAEEIAEEAYEEFAEEQPEEEVVAAEAGEDELEVVGEEDTGFEAVHEEEVVSDEHADFVEAEAVEADEEPFELTEEFIEEDAYEAIEEFGEEAAFEEELAESEPEIVLEAPEIVLEAPEFAEEPAVEEVAEEDEVVEAIVEEAEAEEPVFEEPVAEEPASVGPQPISAAELEQSLEVASQLAQPGAVEGGDKSKALYEAVRLAYDLASYLRDEGNAAVTQEASDSIDALAEQLRELEARDLRDLSIRGPEFALVMVRRGENGELTVLGEVPEEHALVGNAARKLLGR
ncbi:hypothetical protein KUW15_01710 [Qipengyuania aquimaris]|uniref:hypothetical protein n=1 Tax=Qipengyuania aquimaris TaxID=255984 RepID=UPI001C987165|nr:hypothetical protein [Qipengyuania aquimaris]MBY6127424.1 hypothetical protein [Qipengyuania aquimaris]